MAAAAGAAAAAAARKRMLEEEEEMTPYTREELENDWEFKIVRANTNAFRSAATFQKLIGEEGRAGWQLVEKFDNQRVRFKRPRAARMGDAQLPAGVDPYRVQYGIGEGVLVTIILLIIFGALGAFMLAIYLIENAG
jgi:hypothetical protein